MELKFGNTTLSTKHAASSYGVPVLVDALGNAYGPEDNLPEGYGHHTGRMQVAMGSMLHGKRQHPMVKKFLGE